MFYTVLYRLPKVVMFIHLIKTPNDIHTSIYIGLSSHWAINLISVIIELNLINVLLIIHKNLRMKNIATQF